jgi:hypothetical protein
VYDTANISEKPSDVLRSQSEDANMASPSQFLEEINTSPQTEVYAAMKDLNAGVSMVDKWDCAFFDENCQEPMHKCLTCGIIVCSKHLWGHLNAHRRGHIHKKPGARQIE